MGSGGFPISAFTTLDSAEGFNEATRKIRQAMKDRRKRSDQVRMRTGGGGGGGGGGDDGDDDDDDNNNNNNNGEVDSEAEQGYSEARKKNM
ncbi:hypothetical protein CDD83_5084 [Cordyceps sp. RAO-2017]|nr:hypothetical protein CDD83_5084 [Cordyceps sp. RAO-2017]